MNPTNQTGWKAAMPAAGPRVHVPAVDGLRGLAVLTVLVLHFSFLEPANWLESVFIRFTSTGWVGVDLFFVLSGYLITGILLDTKSNSRYFRNFYVRRTLRIFPLYYAYLVVILLLLPMVRGIPADGHQVWIWTYLSNLLMAFGGWEAMPAHTAHLWSLAVEEQFYLLWPLVVYFARSKQLRTICLAIIGLSIATRIGLHSVTGQGKAGYLLLPARLDALAVGSLVAIFARDPGAARQVVRWCRPVGVACLTGLLGLVTWESMRRGDPLPPLALSVQVIGYTTIALMFGALLVYCASSPAGSLAQRICVSRPLLSMGRYSYAIYLFHVPLRNFLRNHFTVLGGLPRVMGSQLPAQIALMVLGILASYALAFASWHTYEKHFLLLKNRLAPNDKPARIVEPVRTMEIDASAAV